MSTSTQDAAAAAAPKRASPTSKRGQLKSSQTLNIAEALSTATKAGFEAKAVSSGRRSNGNGSRHENHKRSKRTTAKDVHSRSFSEAATRGSSSSRTGKSSSRMESGSNGKSLSRSRSDVSSSSGESSFDDENSSSKKMLRELLMLGIKNSPRERSARGR